MDKTLGVRVNPQLRNKDDSPTVICEPISWSKWLMLVGGGFCVGLALGFLLGIMVNVA